MKTLYSDIHRQYFIAPADTETYEQVLERLDHIPLFLVAEVKHSTIERLLYDLAVLNIYKPSACILGRDMLQLFATLSQAPTGAYVDYEYEQEAHSLITTALKELKAYKGAGAYYLRFDTRITASNVYRERYINVYASYARVRDLHTDITLGAVVDSVPAKTRVIL
jgi:hypothetical protein